MADVADDLGLYLLLVDNSLNFKHLNLVSLIIGQHRLGNKATVDLCIDDAGQVDGRVTASLAC